MAYSRFYYVSLIRVCHRNASRIAHGIVKLLVLSKKRKEKKGEEREKRREREKKTEREEGNA